MRKRGSRFVASQAERSECRESQSAQRGNGRSALSAAPTDVLSPVFYCSLWLKTPHQSPTPTQNSNFYPLTPGSYPLSPNYLSDLSLSLVYSYAHSERPAERARIGLRRRSRAAKFCPQVCFFAIISVQSGSMPSRRQIRFPARGTGMARTPGAPPSILRTWDASGKSLGNLT